MNSHTYYQALASQHPRLPLGEELDLMRAAAGAETPTKRNEAIEKLVMHNLDIALSEACKRFGKNPEQLDEACAIAVIALFQSAKKADASLGKAFRSFAYPKVKGQLWEMRHRQAAVVESRYGKAQRRKLAFDSNPNAGATLLDAAVQVLSMDADISAADPGRTLHDVIGGSDNSVRTGAERASLIEALAELPERSRLIMEARFGLGEDAAAGMTLAEVGEKFRLTTERVRQIVAESIQELQVVMT